MRMKQFSGSVGPTFVHQVPPFTHSIPGFEQRERPCFLMLSRLEKWTLFCDVWCQQRGSHSCIELTLHYRLHIARQFAGMIDCILICYLGILLSFVLLCL